MQKNPSDEWGWGGWKGGGLKISVADPDPHGTASYGKSYPDPH
jgi:hypothetical protein